MFGSCRFCHRPTDKWQDFCNDCATGRVTPFVPRLRVIEGGKSEGERPGPVRSRRWLRPVEPPAAGSST